MKQSVAPESTSAFMSAIALLVLIETGICIDRNRVVTITELNLWTALTQADGFRRSENPLFRRDLSSPILVRLLLRKLPLGAMYQLAVVGFECLIVLLLFGLHHRRFCCQLLLRALDFDMESNSVDYCLAYSTYAGGNCDLNAPFYDRCNTQLHANLFAFPFPDSPA